MPSPEPIDDALVGRLGQGDGSEHRGGDGRAGAQHVARRARKVPVGRGEDGGGTERNDDREGHDDGRRGDRAHHGRVLMAAEIVGVETADPLVDLHRQGEEEGGHGRAEHDIGERQGLHDGVDGRPGVGRQVDEYRGVASPDVADLQDEHVGRRLGDRQAEHEVNQVVAADHPVEADDQQPDHDRRRRGPSRSGGRTTAV